MTPRNTNEESGFVLLMTVIIVSIVLAIGLSILEISLKELQLSSLTRESEEAFHASNAGLECVRYWRNVQVAGGDAALNDYEEEGVTISGTECSSAAISDYAPAAVSSVDYDAGTAYAQRYQYEYTWGAGNDRCTEVDVIVAVSSPISSFTVANADLPAKFPTTSDFVCAPGGRCTLAFVQGFSSSCANKSTFGTIQREVLLRF
ncbi:MAG: hypothetical protein AAGA35_00725 [Patescibacteria group bacterium]